MFIDVHSHLDMIDLDSDKIIENARKNNVLIVSDGVGVKSNRKMLSYKNIKICLGIYPDEILEMEDSEIDKEFEFIKKNKDKIIGIGEVGMDFLPGKEREKQEKYFRKFIESSKELDKPITVHSRKAEIECIKILEELKAKKVVMHYFSGNMNLVKRIFGNNWMLSIPTAVKNSEHFQKVIEITPIENLLCETDSPYSHPDKKFPNEPANIIESYKMISKIKDLDLKEVEKIIEKNFKRLFENEVK